LQQEIAQLIVRDGISPETAHDLAQKIIDYERNMLILRKTFASDEVGSTQRYFKRSYNQFIKALRRL
jgi:hypothetical protein